MPTFKGQCYCSSLTYTLTLSNPSGDARTSLCHCGNCKKFTGGPFGITTKISRSAFKYVHGAGEDEKAEGSGSTEDGGPGGGAVRGKEEGDGKEEKVLKVHEADNGSGVVLRREFCGRCGSGILEFGANAGDFIYIFYGTLDHEGRKALAPKGEFFTKYREVWMPEVPGLFQKQEIKQ